jgi:collagenase-like PrtC family protease
MRRAGAAAAKLTLGPVLFNWAPEQKRDFYFRIADEAPVEVVYLGEVVCAKRSPFFDPHLPEVVERLERAGKAVVHSTLALIMSEGEIEAIRELAAAPDLVVEANDISVVALLAGRGHVVGPFVNVYNEGTLHYLAAKGAKRVVLPSELPATSLAALAAGDGPELEVQVFGRLPLALSARCYHARAHGLHKDGCLYVCGEDADGMELDTLEGEPFLAINGTQTLSHTVCNLVHALGELRQMGIACYRLWPHAVDMVAVAEAFRDVLDGREEPGAASARLADLVPFARFSNGFYHGEAGAALLAAARAEAE